MNRLRIAFHLMGQSGWTAGNVYLRNLLLALTRHAKDAVEPYLLGPASAREDMKGYADLVGPSRHALYRRAPRWSLPWAMDAAARRLLSRDSLMERALRARRIQVLFGPLLMRRCPGVAALSWIPDFQHLRLPEMFSAKERRERDRAFRATARQADRVVVMSHAVRMDFEAFAPEYAHKARVLHPVSFVPPSLREGDPRPLLVRYALPEKFVYFPGQVWRHKNHEGLLQALDILKRRGIAVVVVCSGNREDYRHPTHFAELLEKARKWHVDQCVLWLGLVPYEHVLLLMRQSLCVLNPSLFEGWGMSAAEARAVGKRALLSDIPAHREQNVPGAVFFDPRNPADLADKLAAMWQGGAPGPDVGLERSALRNASELRDYAQSFVTLAQEAVDSLP